MGCFVLTATLVVAGILRDFTEVYVRDYEGEKIVRRIIESSTWVHKADLTGSGVITESDYVLFKVKFVLVFCDAVPSMTRNQTTSHLTNLLADIFFFDFPSLTAPAASVSEQNYPQQSY
jgi:hypothetical protein